MSEILELAGLRAVVTGGPRGIGRAVVARLRETGAKVLVSARERPDRLTPQDVFVAADVASAEGCAAVASYVIDGGTVLTV